MKPLALLLVWLALMLLLGLSVGATLLPALGAWRQAVSLGAAVVKAALIGWFFMNMRRADPLSRLAAGAAVVFLAILMTLLAADYLTRT